MLLLFIAEAEMNVPITSMNLLQSDVICVTVNDVTTTTKTDTFVIISSFLSLFSLTASHFRYCYQNAISNK